MASTKIADIIIPSLFNPYVVQQTTVRSELWQSGIVANVPELNAFGSGGQTVTMPFFNDLGGSEEILSDTVPLSVDKITTGTDVAAVHFRGKAWGANGLTAALSGEDPMAEIGNLVANWWARRMQALLIAQLTGIFAAASMSANVYDISGGTGAAAVISAASTIAAQYKLGDMAEGLTAFAMHSATAAVLEQQDLIQTVIPSQGGAPIRTYMGKRVIVDDGMPVSSGNYTSYLFGAGAVGYAEGQLPASLPGTETARDALQGDDILINRRSFVLHVRGVKWAATAAGVSPTNTELQTGTSWLRVYDPKLVRVVKFVHKLS